ncbi:MAG: A/G-specific adenine glycosylase [Hyphomonadaceae bacterium]|nr:A/G-specific adenine glycosylase [Hyphomonadaceae bacterium]GIK50793.1 MAG: A/G-specific adenine glycosylase [Alphaproteobacteria bacterium]
MPALVRRRPAAVDKVPTTRDNLRKSLLSWYDSNGRELPWRVRGAAAEPYRVWLSEIMLQQTTVAAVVPYFERFLARWPTVEALAAAPREELLGAWAGLGYYSRARNLHAAAHALAERGFPADEAGWRTLPGVGPYTAAAIAAIALGQPANVVDGNVERVMARLRAVETPLPEAKARLRELAGELVAAERPGDWAQALMDLGATVCTPKSPKCGACPWMKSCAAFTAGAPETYPRRAAKAERPRRHGAVFLLEPPALSPAAREFWLVRRPDKGLLGGMAALPTTEWRAKKWTRAEALAHAPAKAAWRKIGAVEHVFTHFALTLDVYAADAAPAGDGWWGDASALPTVFKKAADVERGPEGPHARLKARGPRGKR